MARNVFNIPFERPSARTRRTGKSAAISTSQTFDPPARPVVLSSWSGRQCQVAMLAVVSYRKTDLRSTCPARILMPARMLHPPCSSGVGLSNACPVATPSTGRRKSHSRPLACHRVAGGIIGASAPDIPCSLNSVSCFAEIFPCYFCKEFR